jgi:hypothetical protein
LPLAEQCFAAIAQVENNSIKELVSTQNFSLEVNIVFQKLKKLRCVLKDSVYGETSIHNSWISIFFTIVEFNVDGANLSHLAMLCVLQTDLPPLLHEVSQLAL